MVFDLVEVCMLVQWEFGIFVSLKMPQGNQVVAEGGFITSCNKMKRGDRIRISPANVNETTIMLSRQEKQARGLLNDKITDERISRSDC